jgi:ABC-type arginine transport system ATPase subunit
MTEYQTSFQQNAPAYVAVVPIRTGNQSEIGIVRELYLDWNNTPPRAPDDVMLFDKPLPAIDPTIAERNIDEANVSLWF